MRVIETILASFIIITSLAFVSVFAASPASPGFEITDLERMGYSVLHDLDQQQLLAPAVYDQQKWSNLKTLLKISLPVDTYFNLTIYDLHENRLNENTPIMYGDDFTFSDAKNIASITYSLVGCTKQISGTYVAEYEPRILVLQITRG